MKGHFSIQKALQDSYLENCCTCKLLITSQTSDYTSETIQDGDIDISED